jgi:hypothetical protein
MLSPNEFSVGCIGDAALLTLVLPRGKYEYPILVTCASGSPFAIFLEGEHRFMTFDCTGNTTWKGLLMPDVKLEVDETSIVDQDQSNVPLGCLVRKGSQLSISARQERGFRSGLMTPLVVDLVPTRDGMEAAFSRWQIVLGDGIAKRVIKTLDVSAQLSG